MAPRSEKRFGIGEWYGRPFVLLSAVDRNNLARIAAEHKASTSTTPFMGVPDCPFASRTGKPVKCWKKGGVCSLQKVQRQRTKPGVPKGAASTIEGLEGSLRILCPTRFQQEDTIFSWVAGAVFNDVSVDWVTQIRFLKRIKRSIDEETESQEKDVGNIDAVLVRPGTDPLQWCAMEIQAVYFSGEKMLDLFRHVATDPSELPYPDKGRRPDYRSSGAKRLMPQLQTKIPTVRRWGKKMAVVVDEAFFDSLGEIAEVGDISNCDIAWFIVATELVGDRYVLLKRRVVRTTLEAAVEGLTNGKPVTLQEFEKHVNDKH
jgi:hypothetical protein